MFLAAEWALSHLFIAGTTLNHNYALTRSADAATHRSALLQHLSALSQQNDLRAAWLKQIHSNHVLDDSDYREHEHDEADALISERAHFMPIVLTADCVPIVMADAAGKQWAAIHAGWKGLHAGIIAATVKRFQNKNIAAWLAPHIRAAHYEVDAPFYERFVRLNPAYERAFRAARAGHYWADLSEIARQQLQAAGVREISDCGHCSFGDKRFHSYRRDGQNMGHMATFILPRPRKA